jgi:hypothetical protein
LRFVERRGWPIGCWPGQNLAAKLSLTIATGDAVARSSVVKSRPAIGDAPTIRK